MNKTPCPHCGQIHGTACIPPTETIVYPDLNAFKNKITELDSELTTLRQQLEEATEILVSLCGDDAPKNKKINMAVSAYLVKYSPPQPKDS